MNSKKKGSFYTPEDIAVWMSQRAVLASSLKGEMHILEPSCGDGVFLKAIRSLPIDKKPFIIDAVEYDAEAIERASTSYPTTNFFREDFLFWAEKRKYDIIVGNPPYIVNKILEPHQSKKCKQIHISAGLQNREAANIWTSFVVKCTESLSENGVLAFVLPTELLQVKYAKEIRNYLLDNYKRIEVISFKNLAFDGIEQDTVILMAYKSPSQKSGLYFCEVGSVKELGAENINFEEHHGDHDAKWSSYILAEDEIKFIKNIAQQCLKISDICTSVAGIVTAANNYFIVSQKDVDKYNLHGYVKKIIQKGSHVNGSAELLLKDYNVLKNNDKPCYILDLTNVSEQDFNEGLKSYLQIGEESDIPQRYKCQLRKRWFDIPSIWKSDGFFFKRGHHYPKLLVNKANVHVTDSAYRIKMKEGLDIESFTMSFYNSLTLLCSELDGRYYGGGVLELTPNEFKGLPIPRYVAQKNEYKEFTHAFKTKTSIENLLIDNDYKILSSVEGITEIDITHIQELYKKVKNRRLKGAE